MNSPYESDYVDPFTGFDDETSEERIEDINMRRGHQVETPYDEEGQIDEDYKPSWWD